MIRVLGALALVTSTVIAVLVWRSAWANSGAFTIPLVGIPVLCSALVVMAPATGRLRGLSASVAAALALGWSLLTGLGIGGYFLPSALLLVAAASVTWTDRPPTQGTAHGPRLDAAPRLAAWSGASSGSRPSSG